MLYGNDPTTTLVYWFQSSCLQWTRGDTLHLLTPLILGVNTRLYVERTKKECRFVIIEHCPVVMVRNMVSYVLVLKNCPLNIRGAELEKNFFFFCFKTGFTLLSIILLDSVAIGNGTMYLEGGKKVKKPNKPPNKNKTFKK